MKKLLSILFLGMSFVYSQSLPVNGNMTVNGTLVGGSTPLFEQDILSPQVVTGTIVSAKGKQVSVTASTPFTMLNYTGGPGYVSDQWYALGFGTNGDDGTALKITVDGTIIFNDRYDMYMASANYTGSTCTHISQNHFTTNLGGQGNLIPIPFTTSIKIELVPVNSGSIWYDIIYHTGISNNWPRSQHLHVAVGTISGLSINSTATLVDVSGLTQGRFLGSYLYFDGQSASPGTAILEGAIKIYLDGAIAYFSSGTEDYYKMSGYFVAVSAGQNAGEYITLGCDGNSQWGASRFHIPDPFKFQNAFKMTWNAGDSLAINFTGTAKISYLIWYYTE